MNVVTYPTFFSITPNNQEGFVYTTNFTFDSIWPENFTSFVWNFGDGNTKYNSLTAEHSYKYPGTYFVTASAFYADGGIVSDSATITVDFRVRDAIRIASQPSDYGTASIMPTEAFVLEITSAMIDTDITLVLQSINSQSIPHFALPDNKWEFLVPQWKFIDATTNQLIKEQYKVSTTPLKDQNGKTYAVSGTASFFYYDDSPSSTNECPLLLVATLCSEQFVYPPESVYYSYPSYANSEVTRASIGWQINETIPTNLRITENYINEIYPIKWSTIPIPVLITCEYKQSALGITGASATTGSKVLSYPLTNEIGKQNSVKLVLLSGVALDQEIPSNLYTIEVEGQTYSPSAAPLYFRALDKIETPSRGFIFATVTPLVSFDGPVCLSANTVALNGSGEFGFPKGVPIYPYAYISNPKSNNINKIGIVTYSTTDCASVTYYENLGTVTSGSLELLNTSPSTIFNLSNYTISGPGGVYAMAFDPILNRLYTADADQDKIYIYDSPSTTTIPTVWDLSFFDPSNDYFVPSNISIDGDHNLWVSMYGGYECWKFNSSMSLLKKITPDFSFNPSLATAIIEGTPLVSPPILETDLNNDLWVAYAHSYFSFLAKYDSDGNELFKVTDMSLSAVPVSLAIDSLNNVWVACRESNCIECYNENGDFLQRLTGYYKPSYIMFDREGNLWITHGINKITRHGDFSTKTWKNNFTGTQLTTANNTYTLSEINETNSNNERWSGLSIDVFDNVWVIDSLSNTTIVFKAKDPDTTQTTFVINPTTNNVQIIKNNIQQTIVNPNPNPSAQAAGDWTGNRWYQKYVSKKYQTTYPKGKSASFKVLDLNNGIPSIVKINEEFNTAKYFKDLALPEILNKNDIFFDEFLKSLVGDGHPFNESVGRISYERIANFMINHSNLDTAEIEQLISLAKQTLVEVKEFAQNFPSDIERLINLFSINKHYLRGQKHYDSSLENIIGEMLTITSPISTGQTLLMKDRNSNTYQPVYVAPLSGALSALDVYPLFYIQIDSARQPIFDNYFFFEYKTIDLGYKNNIIEWNSPFNTLSYNLSTNEEWYGEDQLIENSFNNLLTRKLFGN